jgi:hypothetical protein
MPTLYVGVLGMKDARSRPRTGEATGDAKPAIRSIEEVDLGGNDVAPSRDWSRRVPTVRSNAPLLVHWVDEKGSVVRLISSSSTPDVEQQGT